MTLEQAKEVYNKLGAAIDFIKDSQRDFLEDESDE